MASTAPNANWQRSFPQLRCAPRSGHSDRAPVTQASVPFAGVSNCDSLHWGDIEQGVQAEQNAFFICDKFEKPLWVELLPAEGPDSDAFDEEL